MPILVNNLSKTYDKVHALESISFEIGDGELFGFLGPDGAGKTSLFRILTTVIKPSSGTASINGLDIISDYRKIRNISGYMPGKFSLYQDLTVEENLRFFATIFGTTIEENYELIKDIYSQIEPFKNRKAGQLSGGMKQKLALSCALIHKPEVLFLDEPTTGVDPVSRKEFWEMLKRLQEKKITILVSTPYMDEAELCDKVALMQSGKILKIETPQEIVKSFHKKILAIKSTSIHRLIIDLEAFPTVCKAYPFGEFVHYTDERDSFDENEITNYLLGRSHEKLIVKLIDPDIEDCFISLMEVEKNG